MAILVADKVYNANGVSVNEYLLTKHNLNKIDMPTTTMSPIGITIHNTDWISVASGTTPAEQYTRATVNGNMNTVRVHYYVDNTCAWQNLPLNRSGWHSADGNGNGNRKTIAIECIMANSTDKKSLDSMDNCAKLTAYLLNKYNWTIEKNLFTHTYWLHIRDGHSGTKEELCTKHHNYKDCPIYIIPQWSKFKTLVQKYLDELNGSKNNKTNTSTITTVSTVTASTEFKPYLIKVNSQDGFVNIRKTPSWKDSDIVGTIKNSNTKYTIIEEKVLDKTTFGKLKSGAGWIALSCCTKT